MKKFLLSFLTFLVFFTSFVPNLMVAHAQSTWYNQGIGDWFLKVYDDKNPSEIFGERYTAAQVQWVFYGTISTILNFFLGTKIAGVFTCTFGSISSNQDMLDCLGPALTAEGSTLEQFAVVPQKRENLWGLVFADRSLSGISYIKRTANKFDLVPEVQAQTAGFGFDVLLPVQGMWTATRDISFGLFVIVAIIFAFMIMFRVKISPQTIITVQSAIPKIIISLVLVTFSYAIAGLLVDLMYIVIGVFSVIGSSLFTIGTPGIITADPFGPDAVFRLLTLGQPLGLNVQIGALGLLAIYLVTFVFSTTILVMINIGAIGVLLGGAAALGVGVLLGVTVNILLLLGLAIIIIMALLLLWHVLRVMWGLLKAFANVILLTILGPLQITIGALIPNFGFGAWMKSYLAALSVFVVTGVLIMFSFIFLAQGIQIGLLSILESGNVIELLVKALFGQSPLNPFTGNQNAWPPLLGGGNGAFTGLLFCGVSFVLFTLIPKATDIVQSFITGRPFAYGNALGEAFTLANMAKGEYIDPITDTMAKIRRSRYASDNIGRMRRGAEQRGIGSEAERAGITSKEEVERIMKNLEK